LTPIKSNDDLIGSVAKHAAKMPLLYDVDVRPTAELVTPDLRQRHGSLDVPQMARRQSPYAYS
jgi:hypothetical protein